MKRLGAWGVGSRGRSLLGALVAFVATAVACAEGADETGAGLAGGAGDGGTDGSVSLPEGGVAPSDGGSSSGRDGSSSGGNECTGKVVINELTTASPSSPDDEFIELFSPNDCEIDLADFELKYKPESGAGTGTVLVTFTNQKIASRGFLVVRTTGFASGGDVPMAGKMAKDGGSVGLFGAGGNQVDAVAWGGATAGFTEGPRAPAAPEGSSIARKTDGVDTNDNKADFAVDASPTPGAPN